MNVMHFGYGAMIVGAVIVILSMALSYIWHTRDANMPDPRAGDRPWGAEEWAVYQNLMRTQRILQYAGVLMLYIGCALSTFGFLVVGIVGYINT